MNTVIKRAWNKNKLVKVEDLTGMTFQAESGGHTFEISGVDDTGAAVSLSGTVEGRFLRADNAEIIISGTASGGNVSVTLSAACYAIPGRFLLTIYVTSNGQKVAVYAATGSVVATSGTAGGSIPPLVTDSVQANTGTFGSIGTGDATVNGVLDVTPRRCYAALSSPGWYRVFNVTAGLGRAGSAFSITLHIGRAYTNTNNELHTVTLLANYNNQEFLSEVSMSNFLGITKARYTADDSNNGHIDIYYNLTDENLVYVDFNVHCRPEKAYMIRYNAVTPTAVSASPSGETELTEYTFAANTAGDITSQITFNNALLAVARRNGNVINISYQGNNMGHSDGEVVATFPSGLQPSSIHWCMGYIGAVPVMLRINPGNIVIWDAPSSPSGRLYFEATYIL